MAKKKSWFYLVKILFISEANTGQEKKEKKRKWMLGRFKAKQLGALAAASPLKGKTLSELEEEQSKHALNVAIATAAAAEAAVAAARAAAEVVHLSVSPQSQPQFERGSRDLAAVKIQTAFRGYLARKALRALKGLVKLQAMVRGRAVRRQAITTLRSLQSLVKIQSQACKMRIRTVEVGRIGEEKKQLQGRNRELGGEETRRSWDGSFLSKEELKAMFLSRVDATIKRERTKKYSFNHQKRRSESDTNMVDGMHDNWLEQWVDSQARKREGLQNFDSIACLNSIDRDVEGGMHLRMIDTLKHEQLEGMNSQISLPRRSFHQQKCSLLGENHSCSSFLAVPGYMAATESAKAKARSISSPKQGLGISDGYYDHSSPSKNRLSLCSSHSSDTTCFSRIGNPSGCQQRSPCIKGLSGLTKSHQTSKDLSFDSELSVLNWSQRGSFR